MNGILCAAAAAVLGASEPTKVLFFFDTEDFIRPESADAIRDIAEILHSERVKGHFAMVGYLGRKLVEWRRYDVIDALRNHHVGTQTLYHSLHPNIAESTDVEDFDAAWSHVVEEESRCIGMLQAATGRDKLWCSVLPGNGNVVAAMYFYAEQGIPFFGGGTGIYDDETHSGDIWFCNQRHLDYAYRLHLELFLEDDPPQDIDRRLDDLVGRDVVTFYMHPHMAVCTKHWDYVFKGGNLHPFGEWPPAPARDPAETERFYSRLKAFVRKVKADPRFEISDCPSLFAAQRPRRDVTMAEISAIRSSLLKDFGPVRSPADWSVADCFHAAVRLLLGDERYSPGRVYGFLDEPKGVSRPVCVTADALRKAAAGLEIGRFLPHVIDVGDAKLGPADFLFAALEVLDTGASEVSVTPKEQLGDVARYLPKMAKASFNGTWIYTPEFKDAWTSRRLRWQFWTFRYEHPPRRGR